MTSTRVPTALNGSGRTFAEVMSGHAAVEGEALALHAAAAEEGAAEPAVGPGRDGHAARVPG